MKCRVRWKRTIPLPGQPNGWRYVRGKYPPLLPPTTFDSEKDAKRYIKAHQSIMTLYRIVPEPKPRARKVRLTRWW